MQDQHTAPALDPSNETTLSVSWEASEYLHHDKDANWTLLFAGVTTILGLLFYIILRDIYSVFIIGLTGLAVFVYGHRHPRTLTYQVNEHGLTIASRFHPYDSFKSFSVIDEGAIKSFVFEPLKRFMPPLTIYFKADDEAKIQDVVSAYLPYKQSSLDPIDKLFKKFRF